MIVSCPSCNIELSVDDDLLKEGENVLQCPNCSHQFTISKDIIRVKEEKKVPEPRFIKQVFSYINSYYDVGKSFKFYFSTIGKLMLWYLAVPFWIFQIYSHRFYLSYHRIIEEHKSKQYPVISLMNALYEGFIATFVLLVFLFAIVSIIVNIFTDDYFLASRYLISAIIGQGKEGIIDRIGIMVFDGVFFVIIYPLYLIVTVGVMEIWVLFFRFILTIFRIGGDREIYHGLIYSLISYLKNKR